MKKKAKKGQGRGTIGAPRRQHTVQAQEDAPSPSHHANANDYVFSASWIEGTRARALARGDTEEVERLDRLIPKEGREAARCAEASARESAESEQAASVEAAKANAAARAEAERRRADAAQDVRRAEQKLGDAVRDLQAVQDCLRKLRAIRLFGGLMLLAEVKRPRRLRTVQPPEQRKRHRVLNQIRGEAAAAKRRREQRQRVQVVAVIHQPQRCKRHLLIIQLKNIPKLKPTSYPAPSIQEETDVPKQRVLATNENETVEEMVSRLEREFDEEFAFLRPAPAAANEAAAPIIPAAAEVPEQRVPEAVTELMRLEIENKQFVNSFVELKILNVPPDPPTANLKKGRLEEMAEAQPKRGQKPSKNNSHGAKVLTTRGLSCGDANQRPPDIEPAVRPPPDRDRRKRRFGYELKGCRRGRTYQKVSAKGVLDIGYLCPRPRVRGRIPIHVLCPPTGTQRARLHRRSVFGRPAQ